MEPLPPSVRDWATPRSVTASYAIRLPGTSTAGLGTAVGQQQQPHNPKVPLQAPQNAPEDPKPDVKPNPEGTLPAPVAPKPKAPQEALKPEGPPPAPEASKVEVYTPLHSPKPEGPLESSMPEALAALRNSPFGQSCKGSDFVYHHSICSI